MSVSVDVVSVFINDAGAYGNLLGIIQASDASAGREQELAAKLGYSETVIIEALADGVATIRIMTPSTELPFAGHPSVGTAWWLAREGKIITTLAERAGDVAVRYDGDLTWITGRAEWAPDFTWLPLATPADVDALDPASFEDLHHYYAYAFLDEAAGELRSRMFAPELGIVEDEATGAAAVAVTTRLGRDLSILQGRGSRIHTRQLPGGYVEVGGRTSFVETLTLA